MNNRRMMMQKSGGGVNPFQNAIAYYAFEETTGNLIDLVNNYDGVLVGGITRGVSGKVNDAYDFGGVDGKIELPISIYNDFDNDNYTVGFWFNTDDDSSTRILLSDFDVNLTDRKLQCFIRNNKVNMVFGDNNSVVLLESVDLFNANQWYFVMIKYDINNKAKLYLNDVFQAEHTFVNAPINENDIWLGTRKTSSFYYRGKIDEMFFMNGQTTRQTDALIYNNGNGITI